MSITEMIDGAKAIKTALEALPATGRNGHHRDALTRAGTLVRSLSQAASAEATKAKVLAEVAQAGVAEAEKNLAEKAAALAKVAAPAATDKAEG